MPTNGEKERLQRSYRQMAAFSQVSSRIVQEDDLDAVCRLFLEAIREHSGYRSAVLTLLDPQGRDFQWFFTGFSDAEIDLFHARKSTPEQRAAAFQERFKVGSSYLLPPSLGLDHGGVPAPAPRGSGEHEAAADRLVIPLHGAGGSLVGTVALEDPRDPVAPTAEALSPLELFATQVAHAIEKKSLDQAVKSVQARLLSVQQQLMQAEKLSAIGQLVSGVAHELSNPLSAIIGFSQLLLASEVNPKLKKNIERIHDEAVRSQKIVQNLLGFSRRHKPEKTYRSLNEAIDGVLELRAYQLKVDNVEVIRKYEANLPRTMLDVHQIQQVVLNVVNNAHQAMMEVSGRPGRLVVTTERLGSMVRARFTDNGTGIARDRLESIFEPFFTTKKEGKGTGLGLSLSRAIVKDHLGTMVAESVLSEGASILIDLPIIEEPQSAPAQKDGKVPASPPAPLKLLVVDDERILVELLCEFLKSAGHDVDDAGDGKKALELASVRDYDIILTDLKMPGLDGQGLYERLCKLKPHMAHRFVFSTGDLANPKVQTFFQSTGCLYLSKPFKLEAVLTVLDQVARRLRVA